MKSKFFKPMALLWVAATLTSACNKDASITMNREIQDNVLEVPLNETFVSANKAADIATAFFGTLSNNPATKSNARIATTETIRDSKRNNEPIMYVMNYADGGFVIVGATKDYYPILAYSDTNNFVYNEEIGGLVIWMEETKEAIRQSGTLDAETKVGIRNMWREYEPQNDVIFFGVKTKSPNPEQDAAFENRKAQLSSSYPDFDFYRLEDVWRYLPNDAYSDLCDIANNQGFSQYYAIVGVKTVYTNQTVGPLLDTRWGQGDPFNYYCPSNHPAGCVAIAMAQIMKKYEWPTSMTFNGVPMYWNNMPDYGWQTQPATSYSTPLFIRALGVAVEMNYNSGGSHPPLLYRFTNHIIPAFKKYGYNVKMDV